jgi:hypothetical protein
MKPDEYKYLAETLSGRRPRDPEFEEQISATIEGAINQKAAERQRQLDSLTPEQREIEQRRYSLRTYGREHMRRYANPIISDKPLGELEVPGDQIRNTSQVKGHNGEKPGPWQDANGRLLLQNHAACPQNQVLKLR